MVNKAHLYLRVYNELTGVTISNWVRCLRGCLENNYIDLNSNISKNNMRQTISMRSLTLNHCCYSEKIKCRKY